MVLIHTGLSHEGGLIFEGIVPDLYDIIGAVIACAGVAIIYYAPRKGEEKLWSNQ
jgi:drug/metabolite transporter superfamily protein YnfA